jgi:hypothetical protein
VETLFPGKQGLALFAVFERWRAEWRRGRASKVIQFGAPQTFQVKTPTAGLIDIRVRFDDEGKTLGVRILESYAHDVLEKGQYRADMGVPEVRKFLAHIARAAADLGFKRMRVSGQRTRQRRQADQVLDFGVEQYLQDEARR